MQPRSVCRSCERAIQICVGVVCWGLGVATSGPGKCLPRHLLNIDPLECKDVLFAKKRREVLAPGEKLRNVMLRSEAPASSAQDETPSINPGQEMRNSS